jgi:hypothetical protein
MAFPRTNKTKKKRGPRITDLRARVRRYAHHAAPEPPLLEPISLAPIPHQTVDDVKAIGQEILATLIASLNYSLLPYFFIPDLRIATQDYVVNKHKSGNCAFFANKVVHALHKQGLQGILIPATLPPSLLQPGYPEYAHVSVLIPLDTHLVLLEPAYFIIDPICVPRDGSAVDVPVPSFETTWTYRYSKEDNKILVSEGGTPQFYYLLQRILNPSESISYPVTIRNQRPPIVTFDPIRNCKIAHLSVRLDKRVLEGYHESLGWFDPLEFASILALPTERAQLKRLADWPGTSDDVCKALGWSPTDLRKKLLAIVLQSSE